MEGTRTYRKGQKAEVIQDGWLGESRQKIENKRRTQFESESREYDIVEIAGLGDT